MSCSLTCGVSFISSATFSRCTLGKKLDTPAKPRNRRRAARRGPAAEPERADRERHARADRDLAVLVVHDQEVRVRQHVDVAVGLQRLDQHAERRDVERRGRRRRPGCAASSGDSTGPSTPASIVSVSAPAGNNVLAGLRPPTARLWLSSPGMFERLRAVERRAELALLVERDLEDHRLDEHLLARRIEPLDHPAHRLVVLQRRHDDQRVGRAIEVDPDVALEQQVLDALRLAARRRGVGGGAAPRCLRRGARPPAPPPADADGHAGDRAQRLRQLVAVGVLAVVDVDAPVAALDRHVQLARPCASTRA